MEHLSTMDKRARAFNAHEHLDLWWNDGLTPRLTPDEHAAVGKVLAILEEYKEHGC